MHSSPDLAADDPAATHLAPPAVVQVKHELLHGVKTGDCHRHDMVQQDFTAKVSLYCSRCDGLKACCVQ